MAAPQPTAKERKKNEEMLKTTVEARKKHNLPESEVVIEGKKRLLSTLVASSTHSQRTDFGTLGTEHMLVTPNFILGSDVPSAFALYLLRFF